MDVDFALPSTILSLSNRELLGTPAHMDMRRIMVEPVEIYQ